MENIGKCGRRIAVSAVSIIAAVFLAYMVCMPVHATEMGTIVEQWQHVYVKADADSNIVANVILGDIFPILDVETDEAGNVWYLIETNMGVQGYIPAEKVITSTNNAQNENTHERDVQVQEQEPVAEDEDENNLPDSVKEQLFTMQVVNIRENPSTSAEVVGKIPSGTTLDYIDSTTNTMGEIWYEISYEDISGFVKQSTVQVMNVPVSGTDGAQPYETGTVADGIDVEWIIETARQYQDENPQGQSVAQPDTPDETQIQEQEVYEDLAIAENTGKRKNILEALLPDMVIVLSFVGILLCTVIIWRTYKRLIGLYR